MSRGASSRDEAQDRAQGAAAVASPSRLLLIGHPVAHSLSPRFQQAALDAAGIPLRYEARDVPPDQLATTLRELKSERAAGNITVPHKQAALASCDVLTPLAKSVGAVNTFWTDADGRLHGDNTDVGGFEAAARALLDRDLSGLRVLLIGVGGAALAVRTAVEGWDGATLHVLARRRDAARAFAAPLGARASVVEDSVAADLIVNATPLGLKDDDPHPVNPERIAAGTAVLDMTYRRDGSTGWVTACRARGLRADDGLTMLLEQGALAFERWFARPAPRAVMRAGVGR